MLTCQWSRLCGRVFRSKGWKNAAPALTRVSWSQLTARRRYHGDLGDLYENESVQRHLRRLVEEHGNACEMLQHASLSEADRKVLTKRHVELQPVADVFVRMERGQKDLEEVLSVLHGERPPRAPLHPNRHDNCKTAPITLWLHFQLQPKMKTDS